MVRFGLDWFGLVWFSVFLLIKVVLVSIRTKFELSMCFVCPTIDIKGPFKYYISALGGGGGSHPNR